MIKPLLEVNNLTVEFYNESTDKNTVAIQDVNFSLSRNESLGIIGESGSGKSITLLSLMGLIDKLPGIVSGSINLNTSSISQNLLQDIEQFIILKKDQQASVKSENQWKKRRELHYKRVRGKEISMIFQNPKLAFNPFYSIGNQINEMIRLHTSITSKKEAKSVAIEWLRKVKIEAPEIRYNNNPYGLSGGMCQRAMIAMALASQPSIIIADEPTTGLDATIQADIVDLLRTVRAESLVSMIVVSHDLNVIKQLADNIIVYYKGRIVEQGPTNIILNSTRENSHPYTRRLLDANAFGYVDTENQAIEDSTNYSGCSFSNQCKLKHTIPDAKCDNQMPDLIPLTQQHSIRCWGQLHD